VVAGVAVVLMVVVKGGEGINWRATGMGRWGAIGRRRFVCMCISAKPETARTVTPPRREKTFFRILARPSGGGRPEGMMMVSCSAQATRSAPRCIYGQWWGGGGAGGGVRLFLIINFILFLSS